MQDLKRVFTTLRADIPNTATPPPRTDVKGEYFPAPLAEQFQKVVDNNTTEVLPIGTSNDTAPPLLFEAVPTAPIATVTEQLLRILEHFMVAWHAAAAAPGAGAG